MHPFVPETVTFGHLRQTSQAAIEDVFDFFRAATAAVSAVPAPIPGASPPPEPSFARQFGRPQTLNAVFRHRRLRRGRGLTPQIDQSRALCPPATAPRSSRGQAVSGRAARCCGSNWVRSRSIVQGGRHGQVVARHWIERASRRKRADSGWSSVERGAAGAAGRIPIPGEVGCMVVGTQEVGGCRATSRDRVRHYRSCSGGNGCGGEFMRTNTWSHEVNRNSRKADRTSSQNARRELKKVRTR